MLTSTPPWCRCPLSSDPRNHSTTLRGRGKWNYLASPAVFPVTLVTGGFKKELFCLPRAGKERIAVTQADDTFSFLSSRRPRAVSRNLLRSATISSTGRKKFVGFFFFLVCFCFWKYFNEKLGRRFGEPKQTTHPLVRCKNVEWSTKSVVSKIC